MELNGKKVKHKKFGVGVIRSIDDKYISIEFNGRERSFALGDALLNCLADTDEISEYLKKLILSKTNKVKPELKTDGILIKRHISAEERQSISLKDKYSLAVNMVYCDGGKNERIVGFNGICSDELLEDNVQSADGRWCSIGECPCRVYLESEGTVTRRELDSLMDDYGFVCYESRTLRDWVVCAGAKNNRLPVKLDTAAGKFCVLTALENGCDESERYIFGLYIIETIDADINDMSRLWAEERYRYAFSPKQAEKMRFWDFVDEEPSWGSDRFLYLSDEICLNILKKAAELSDSNVPMAMLDYYKELNGL